MSKFKNPYIQFYFRGMHGQWVKGKRYSSKDVSSIKERFDNWDPVPGWKCYFYERPGSGEFQVKQ